MKKSIFLFFAAILCAMTANAFDQSNVDLYFDNSTSKWEKCYVYIGKDSYTSCFDMTRVSGTQYLWKLAKGFDNGNTWKGANGWVVCKEKWWSGSAENVYKFVYHGNNNVTNITTSAWSDSKIYKANGTQSVNHFSTNCTVYKVTSSTKSDYKVTINTVEGGTLTVKDFDDQAVASGDSKIHLTVLKFSATPASGYVLDAVEINDGTNTTTIAAADLATTTHTLTSAITINPVWRATTSTVTVTATATNGTVTGGGVVEEGTSVTLTATPDAGYQFVNWTVGGAEVSTANPYTFTAEEDVTVVANFEELPKVTVYAINSIGWAAVAVHHWHEGGAGTAWPGDLMTTIAEKDPNGFDVYTATFLKEHENCIFNNNNQGSQTGTLAVKDGQYYDLKSNTWYASLAEVPAPDPLATDVYLAGEMTNWGTDKVEFKKETAEGTIASVTVNLTAKSYTFQLVIDGTWYGNKSTMKRGGDAVHEGGWSFKDTSYGANCTIVADFPGDYTFTWNLETEKLTVTYPELPTYTVTATAENGTVTGDGEYKHGTEATLVATPNTGYAFVNWKKGEEVVSSEASYTFTVTANTDLVATFAPEVTHEVTVSYICNSNPIPGHAATTLAVGVTTPSTITAPAITHYTFDGWTLGTGVQSEDDSKNPIQITTKAEGEYTLKANYTKIELTYNVQVPAETEKCYIAGEMNSWAFQEMTKVDDTHYTITIDGATTAHKYKYACGDGWAYVEKDKDGNEIQDRTWTENDVVAKWAEPVKCYLMGIGGDWTTGIEMEEDGDQFKLLCQPIAEGEQFKFKHGDTWSDGVANHDFPGIKWVDDDEDGNSNITLPAGNYNFYYKKETNKVYIAAATDCVTEPEYNVVEDEITNFVFDTEAWPMVCMGGPSTNYQIEIFLTLTEDADGTLAYEDCSVSIMGTDATFIDGTLSNIDVYAPYADAVLHVQWDGDYYELQLAMSSTPAAAITIEAEDATVTLTEYPTNFEATEFAYELNMVANWVNEAESLPYRVEFIIPTFDPTKASGEYIANFYVTGEGDAAGMNENILVTVTKDGNNVTLTGNVSALNGNAYNATISGTLPVEETPDYTRSVTPGHYGTICLPYASSNYTGMELYEVSWLQKNGETPVNLYLDQLAADAQLEAGKPYIFRATSDELTVTYTGAPVDAPIPADENNGLTGSFVEIPAGGVLTGNYVVAQNKFWTATETAYAKANRAYIDKAKVPYTEQKQIPGRRRVSLGAAGENAETGIDNIITTDTPVKVIENGQLIIIRDGEKYNAQGQKL